MSFARSRFSFQNLKKNRKRFDVGCVKMSVLLSFVGTKDRDPLEKLTPEQRVRYAEKKVEEWKKNVDNLRSQLQLEKDDAQIKKTRKKLKSALDTLEKWQGTLHNYSLIGDDAVASAPEEDKEDDPEDMVFSFERSREEIEFGKLPEEIREAWRFVPRDIALKEWNRMNPKEREGLVKTWNASLPQGKSEMQDAFADRLWYQPQRALESQKEAYMNGIDEFRWDAMHMQATKDPPETFEEDPPLTEDEEREVFEAEREMLMEKIQATEPSVYSLAPTDADYKISDKEIYEQIYERNYNKRQEDDGYA